jgi:hypothetical protein
MMQPWARAQVSIRKGDIALRRQGVADPHAKYAGGPATMCSPDVQGAR